jgi:hypothetical protein
MLDPPGRSPPHALHGRTKAPKARARSADAAGRGGGLTALLPPRVGARASAEGAPPPPPSAEASRAAEAASLRLELSATRVHIRALEGRLSAAPAAAPAPAAPASPRGVGLLLLSALIWLLLGRVAPFHRAGPAAPPTATHIRGGSGGFAPSLARCTRAQAEGAGAAFSWELRREPTTLTAAAPPRRRAGEVFPKHWEKEPDLYPPAPGAATPLPPDARGPTDVLSCADPGGCLEYALALPGCNLSAIAPLAARRCLAGRHVMFVGDSVTRYQFLGFAQMLEHAAHVAWDPPSEHDNRFGTWENFFRATTERLGPHGACDCFRPLNNEPQALLNEPDGHEVWGVLGNRYYRHPAARLEATFIEALGEHPNTVWHEPRTLGVDCEKSPWGLEQTAGEACPAAPLCAPGACRNPHHVEAWDVGLRRLIARTRPDVIVINSGLWGVQWRGPASAKRAGTHLELLMAALDWAAAPAGGGVRTIVWKTTTAQLDGVGGAFDFRPLATQAEVDVVAAFRARGWPVLDTHALSAPLKALAMASEEDRARIFFHRDAVHFARSIYRAFNELLLALLCEEGAAAAPSPSPAPSAAPAHFPRSCAPSSESGPFEGFDLSGTRADKFMDAGLSGVSLDACCEACVAEPQCKGYVWGDPKVNAAGENCWPLKWVTRKRAVNGRTAGYFAIGQEEPDWSMAKPI